MYKIKILPSVKQDIFRIARYISDDLYNLPATGKFLFKTKQAIDNLSLFPRKHAIYDRRSKRI